MRWSCPATRAPRAAARSLDLTESGHGLTAIPSRTSAFAFAGVGGMRTWIPWLPMWSGPVFAEHEAEAVDRAFA